MNEWHDLTENPEDLPPLDERYPDSLCSESVIADTGDSVTYCFPEKRWHLDDTTWLEVDVKKWRNR